MGALIRLLGLLKTRLSPGPQEPSARGHGLHETWEALALAPSSWQKPANWVQERKGQGLLPSRRPNLTHHTLKEGCGRCCSPAPQNKRGSSAPKPVLCSTWRSSDRPRCFRAADSEFISPHRLLQGFSHLWVPAIHLHGPWKGAADLGVLGPQHHRLQPPPPGQAKFPLPTLRGGRVPSEAPFQTPTEQTPREMGEHRVRLLPKKGLTEQWTQNCRAPTSPFSSKSKRCFPESTAASVSLMSVKGKLKGRACSFHVTQ